MGGTQKPEQNNIDLRLAEILSEVKKIHNAFPRDINGDTDFDGHREYHEAMIRAAEAQAAFWNELKLDVVKKGVWGAVVIIVGLVITGIAAKFGLSHNLH